MKRLSRGVGVSLLVALALLSAWRMFRAPVPAPSDRAIAVSGETPVPPSSVLSPVIAATVTQAVTSVGAADDSLQTLRRAFRPEIKTSGSPSKGMLPVELEGFRIYPPSDRSLSLGGSDDRRVAFIIQFTSAIRPEWKERVQKAGGHIHGYVPHNALSVHMSPRAAKSIFQKLPHIASIFPLGAEHKVQPFLSHLVQLPAGEVPRQIQVTVNTYDPSSIEHVRDELAAVGANIIDADAGRRWGLVRARVPRDQVMTIASWPEVQWVEEYVPPRPVNDRAALGEYMNVTNVWVTHGLSGAGQIIGHADTGLDVGNYTNIHPDFTGRIVAAFDLGRPGRWDDPDGHGTHTAGSIVGDGTASTGQFRGIAWSAGLVHQSVMDGGGGLGGLPADLNDLYFQTYELGARVHADSWGASVYGYYTTDSRQSDEFMWDHPEMLLVFAAGNDGYDTGDGVIDPDTIGSPATAKNLLTVGAAEGGRPPGSGGLSSYTYGNLWPWDYSAAPINGDYVSQPADLANQGMAAFSSRGPTDDGRIKPEVVGPGTDVVSTRSRAPGAGVVWGAHPNSAYAFGGGTSMSTPLVAGAAALIREYFADYRAYAQPSAALVKAALMHGARSLSPGQYGTGAAREIPAASPNHVEGWGQVNVEHSLFPSGINWFYVDEKSGLSAPGQVFTSVFYAATGTVKITVNYTDFPATAGAGMKLVNDLDLSLEGPGVATNALSQDRTNNFERLLVEVSAAGIHTVRVEAINIPSGPQPFALIVSGPVIEAPVIVHTPLQNQYETNAPYEVSASVLSSSPLGSNAVSLFWREASSTSGFIRVFMTNAGGSSYSGYIPAQPNPSSIEYYLAASNEAFVVTDPAGAPEVAHAFFVNDPVTLTVSGSPAAIFSVNPDYGVHLIASGNVVNLSAPAYSNVSPGLRLSIAGWTGSGSVPATGTSNAVDVVFETDSSIQWNWVNQYSLTQTSTVAGIINTTTWWNAWTSAVTVTAEAELDHNAVMYGFAGWRIDGARYPNSTAVASNPAASLTMFGPRTALAVYLPAEQDLNANSLPDWWEQFYFGTNVPSAGADADGDGFTNDAEYQDRTNPRDAASVPVAPVIGHTALSDPQTSPAPWLVSASVTDNAAVNNVFLHWQKNGGAWTSMMMSAQSATSFVANLPAPGTNSDQFVYRIEATDYAGLTATNGPYMFNVAYPRMRASPASFGIVNVPALTASNVFVHITNAGSGPLVWNLDRALFYDHMELGTNGWTHAGANDVWHIDTRRHYSTSNAWHFGSGPGGSYPDAANASLYMPALYLDQPADLVFRHWAKMEYDIDQNDDHYWDGGVVELSTNGGASYAQIFPEGGYPHRITDNPDSPFAPDTPCYGETVGWEEAVFDLSAFTGATVNIRFRFGSDFYVVDEGWYIDDIQIRYRDNASWFWIATETGGVVAASQTTNAAVTLDTTGLALGERRDAILVLRGNDPELNAPLLVPVGLHNATREIVVSHSANGTVSPSGVVWVVQGKDQSWSLQGDPLYMIDAVYTNGAMVSGVGATTALYFTWFNIQSNGTLHVDFAENIVLGLVPEWWLAANGLTNPPPEQEAVTDHDGDGMLSWQEYVAGTEPTNAGSVALMLHDADEMPMGNVFRWISYTNANVTYDLEASTNLAAGFHALVTNIQATPPVNSYTNSSTNLFEILRVRAIWPD